MEDTKPLVTDKKEFQNRDETLEITLFGISEDQSSKARNKFDIFTTENFLKIKKFFIEILTEEMKLVVMGNNGR